MKGVGRDIVYLEKRRWGGVRLGPKELQGSGVSFGKEMNNTVDSGGVTNMTHFQA
jgi:hypothetical protein